MIAVTAEQTGPPAEGQPVKRGRGRPRIHPPKDPNAPPKKRGPKKTGPDAATLERAALAARLFGEGKNQVEIAEHLGVTRQRVEQLIRLAGLPARPQRKARANTTEDLVTTSFSLPPEVLGRLEALKLAAGGSVNAALEAAISAAHSWGAAVPVEKKRVMGARRPVLPVALSPDAIAMLRELRDRWGAASMAAALAGAVNAAAFLAESRPGN